MNRKIIIATIIIAGLLLLIVIASFGYLNRKQTQSNQEYDAQRVPTITAEQNSAGGTVNEDAYVFPPTQDELTSEQEYYKIQYPDVFLVNNLPYETSSFRVTNQTLRNDGVYVIQVTPKIENRAQIQQEFITWVQSLGLSPEQISSLIIEYQ